MKHNIFMLFLFLFLFQFSAIAETKSSWREHPDFQYNSESLNINEEVKHLEPQEFSNLIVEKGGNGKGELYIPLDVMDLNLIKFAAATSLGLIIFKNDEKIMDFVQDKKEFFPGTLQDFGYAMGYRTGIGAVVIGSYFLGVVMDNDKLKKVGIITVAAEIATGIVTESFKTAFARKRPSTSPSDPYQFFVKGNHKSFFSGHVSAAFSLATIISEIYGDDYPVVPYLAYGVAAITAYSRMHANAHWGSDVLVAAIAGVLVSKIVYYIIERDRDETQKEEWLVIKPSYNLKTGSIQVKVDYVPKAWRPR